MARRGPAANLREQAVELLAQGDKPEAVAVALGITEEVLRDWRKRRAFSDAVARRSHQLLREAIYPVFRRMIEQAEAGQAAQQNALLRYLVDIDKLAAERSSERWQVTWSGSAPTTPPVAAEKDDGGE
jgi:hypothetical protein